jgi:hypothetical protein
LLFSPCDDEIGLYTIYMENEFWWKFWEPKACLQPNYIELFLCILHTMPTYLHICGAYWYVYMYTYSLDLSIVYGVKLVHNIIIYVCNSNFYYSKDLGFVLLHTTNDHGLTW